MAVFWYRISHYLLLSRAEKLWILPVNLIMRRMETKYGIRIPPRVPIGSGFVIWHSGLTVLHYDCVIGSNVNIRQGVTIGQAGRGDKKGAPVIGDRVDIGVNAVIIGKITIGEDAVIGAGAIVRKDVPARAVVVGDPQKIVSYRGSFDFVEYPGMENDPARLESMSQVRVSESLSSLSANVTKA